MADPVKDTDVSAPIVDPNTNEPVVVDVVEPAQPEPVTTPDVTPPPTDVPSITEEQALENIKKLGKDKLDEPSRRQKTIDKIVTRLEDSVSDGEVDYEFLSKNVADTPIGNKALEAFASANNLDLKEVKRGMLDAASASPIGDIAKNLEFLMQKERAREESAEDNSFVELYKSKLMSYGLTPAQFQAAHGPAFEKVFQKYLPNMSKAEAAELAFELTAGKDLELVKKAEELRQKEAILHNGAMPTPPVVVAQPKEAGLMTRDEVANLPRDERIAYKKKFNEQVGMRTYVVYKD